MDYLYRAGKHFVDRNGRRCIFTETFATTDPEVSDVWTRSDLLMIAQQYDSSFSVSPWYTMGAVGAVAERLWPTRHCYEPLNLNRLPACRPLNPNAPEAALRLRRVGGSGTDVYGRVCFPIFDDSYFSDLPHRRHISPAVQLPLWPDHGFGDFPFQWTGHGRVYTNCIWHAEGVGWEPVVGRVLMPNPVRVWNRLRVHPDPGPGLHLTDYVPQERTVYES